MPAASPSDRAIRTLAQPAEASDCFVGRREELALLLEAFDIALASRGRYVPIEGEAGIGKSRLIAEFGKSIGTRATIARGDCSEHVRNPYGPLWPILESIAIRAPRRPASRHDRRPDAAEKAAFFESAVLGLTRAAARRPIVAIVEDLQWADSATLELLGYIVQNVRHSRVLVVTALRTDRAADTATLARFRHFAARQRIAAVHLGGLRRNDIRRLIGDRLGSRQGSIAPDALTQIEALSEGNPLYAQELARIAVESGALDLASRAPLSLQATLGERLVPLSRDERAVLVRAAICGRRFHAGFLAEIVDRPLDDVLHAAQAAVDAGILVASPQEPLEFVFRHAMFRQAFADQMIVGLAAPLHARIARAIETHDRTNLRVSELAYHWAQARVADRARYYNERAADAAWGVYAYRDAIGFYLTALRWDYPTGLERAALYERVGTLLSIEGCGEEPTQWFEKSRAEYAAAGNREGASRALLRLADQYWVDARTPDSYAAATQASAAMADLHQPVLSAEASLTLARYAITLGDADLAAEHLASAEALHAHFEPAQRACYHEIRAETLAASGLTRAALEDCRIASSLAHDVDSSELVAQVENNCALVAFDLGALDLALERHQTAVAESRRTAMSWRVAYSALNYAHTLTFTGELERARTLVWEAVESGVTTATFKTKAAAVGIPLGLLLNDRRLLDVCTDERAPDFAARSGEPQRIASVAAAFAELRLAQGARDEACKLLAGAFDAIARPHRCVGLVIAAAPHRDVHARALQLLSHLALRPRVRRTCALLVPALFKTASQPRIARAAASACARMGWLRYQAAALEAAGASGAARQRYERMGDVRDATRLRDAAAADAHTLSPRQGEIARLVADGQTNRAIAARLHISEHTVEHHLSTIFARLHLRSRSALAAFVGRTSHDL